MFAQVGSVSRSSISRKRRSARSRHSSSHAGSFFLAEISRTIPSSSPGGIDSLSISVTNPYSYSRVRSRSSAASFDWAMAHLSTRARAGLEPGRGGGSRLEPSQRDRAGVARGLLRQVGERDLRERPPHRGVDPLPRLAHVTA